MNKQPIQFTQQQLIQRLGALTSESKKMMLIIPTSGPNVVLHSTSFNYKDVQQLTYILQRTRCEWVFKPISDKLIGLYIYLL